MSTRPASTNRLPARFFKALIARCATMVIKFMRIPKKSLVALVGAGLVGSANGALIVDQSNSSGVDNQFFSADITNDTGVTLDSATLDYSKLFADTATLDWNKSLYTNNGDNTTDSTELSNFISYLKDNNLVSFTLDNLGDVYTGWSGNIGNDGIVDITGDGFEESWNDNQTMETFLGIDNSLYTNPETNTIVPINLDSNATISDFATASAGTGTVPFTADGLGYNVVPEPSQYAALAGALALGLAAYRRPTRKE